MIEWLLASWVWIFAIVFIISLWVNEDGRVFTLIGFALLFVIVDVLIATLTERSGIIAMDLSFIQGLLVGSVFWFWGLIALEVIVLLLLTERQKGISAFVSVIAALLIFNFLFQQPILSYIIANPLTLLMWAGGYIVIGILYGIFRWDRKGAKWRRRFDTATNEREQKESLKYKPDPWKSRDEILIWMAYWPINSIWWLVADFIAEIWDVIYTALLGVFVKIANRHTKGIDLEKLES